MAETAATRAVDALLAEFEMAPTGRLFGMLGEALPRMPMGQVIRFVRAAADADLGEAAMNDLVLWGS